MDRPLNTFLACTCSAHVLPEVRDAMWGRFGYRVALATDDAPGEVVVQGFTFLLNTSIEQREALRRHEAMHEEQRARFAPDWAPKWFPRSVLAYLGAEGFWKAYRLELGELGFIGNRFEIEARRAERPELVLGEDDPTPAPPRPR